MSASRISEGAKCLAEHFASRRRCWKISLKCLAIPSVNRLPKVCQVCRPWGEGVIMFLLECFEDVIRAFRDRAVALALALHPSSLLSRGLGDVGLEVVDNAHFLFRLFAVLSAVYRRTFSLAGWRQHGLRASRASRLFPALGAFLCAAAGRNRSLDLHFVGCNSTRHDDVVARNHNVGCPGRRPSRQTHPQPAARQP